MVCQTKVTIERQMPSHSWRMEKLIVTIMLFYTANDESRWIKEH
jgi:hypothetical protein